MTPDPETEHKIADTAFRWLDYDNYGSEQSAVKAFRRRKGMSKFDRETVRGWLSAAVGVRKRLEAIATEIAKSHGKGSHYYLSRDEYEKGTDTLTARLSEEYPEMKETVSYMISMAWHMYYHR